MLWKQIKMQGPEYEKFVFPEEHMETYIWLLEKYVDRKMYSIQQFFAALPTVMNMKQCKYVCNSKACCFRSNFDSKR